MLQGPPGTGKTEFIAAFVHFLIEKDVAKQILLVSQSHEAVNTAAERIRKHCSRLETHLEVVRFSNREGAVSVGLKDVYSNSIISEKRELFKAEFKYRIEMLSDALGLQAEYLSRLVSAELKIFNQIDKYVSLFNTLGTKDVDDHDKKEIKKLIAEMDSRLRESLKVDYDLELSAGDDLRKSRELLVSKLDDDFNIRPDESRHAQALAKITREMLNVLETDRVNYDEFLARSRQLVTGTCVGIGQPHIGIQNNQYDWVIIDEAARSIASELAIAMQSGKRILLVGDHQQLPPLYSKPHKQALARKLGIPVKGEELDELLQSDFARAFESSYGHQTGVQLLTQYRMAPEIGNLVSHTFYDEKLKNGDRIIPDIYVSELRVLKKTVTWIDTSLMKERAYHRDDRGSSIYNRHEADVIIKILKSFSKNDNFISELSKIAKKDEPAIGVICMYSEQKKLIRQKFNEVSWDDGFKELIKIDTVDSYQGKENRIIILSITAYDKEQAPRFLRSPNRINVALSRAMDRLIIVGAADMWRTKNRNLPLGRVVSYMLDKGSENGYIFLDSNKAVEQF
jgi:KaiC/GvpD/RAD55 family RecA-like ATPase